MRMSEPSLELGLRALAEEGARRVVVVPLAPFSVGVYTGAARQAAERANVTTQVVEVEPWGTEPALIAAWASQIRPFLTTGSPPCALVLTAHSLPVSVIAGGDPYADEFNRCANAVMAALGRSASIAYQSQGDSGAQWMAPTLLEAVRGVRDQGAHQIVVAPVGFLSDHLETLYDLDIEARAWAEDVGLAFSRVPALNDHPGLIDAMAAVVDRALSTEGKC
jgi:ferrochelatase